eukprot:CAMPEP_0177681830 /NCGR_PEP_ID=MMETSP0447-20121125/30932_1 /TAXON_ID=0 /ORGANISM="Stygamoeba regulata, Strain BSH-02190019" /LENGTH=476 /DNA_ID=CAMNT_0019191287 /DNA_START=108 /DNA_END=1538 /DNA_ORIENTATION=-
MAEKAGFLTKEGGSIKTWKRRWCVLKNGALHYSKSQTSQQLGIIPLDKAGKIETTDLRLKKGKKHCFIVETPQRTYFIDADTEDERNSWIKELCAVRDQLQGKVMPKASTSTASSSSASAAAPAAKTSAPPAKAAEENEAPQEKRVGLEDFEMLTVIGKGSFGKVIQVRKIDTGKIYAMKVLNKKTIIERNELEHTKAEKSILQKLVHPFLVNLNYSFQTKDKLYFIMDYINGGELFFHLQKDKKFTEDRVQFYCAEIVCGLEYLHANGVLYRDLKPENLLLTADGNICMTDFGISKEGLNCDDDRTSTFCGTPEYLAPEVLEGNGYGKAVDWWSFGTLMFEMLTGLPPFYSQDVQQMYSKIMSAKLNIPKSISPEARDLLEKLLERDPDKRLTDPKAIKAHPWFKNMDWDALLNKQVKPPFIPPVKDVNDTSMVDPAFLGEDLKNSVPNTSDMAETKDIDFDGFTYVAPTTMGAQ